MITSPALCMGRTRCTSLLETLIYLNTDAPLHIHLFNSNDNDLPSSLYGKNTALSSYISVTYLAHKMIISLIYIFSIEMIITSPVRCMGKTRCTSQPETTLAQGTLSLFSSKPSTPLERWTVIFEPFAQDFEPFYKDKMFHQSPGHLQRGKFLSLLLNHGTLTLFKN